jgi:hypothetical protein
LMHLLLFFASGIVACFRALVLFAPRRFLLLDASFFFVFLNAAVWMRSGRKTGTKIGQEVK